MSNNRRATLGPVSSSTLNSRLSLGPAKTNDHKLSSRMSIGGILNQTINSNIGGFSNTGRPSYLNSSRKSLSIQQQQQQQSSLLSSTAIASGTATTGQSRTNNISSASRLPDPRSIGEKQFMNNSIRQLIDYLTKHSYDGAISPKILSKPTNKDFMNITLFLFKQYDPNYKFTGKFEDEMITMFKYLGYPFNICKSNISAVGSPHTWPTLLACIMWLVELLNYNEVCDAISNNNNSNNNYDVNQQVSSSSEVDDENTANNNNNNNQDPSSSEKAFYRYLGKAYQLFLSGKDDQYSQLESQFINYFNNKNILIQDQIETYEKRNHALQYEIETIKKRSLYLPELITKKKEFQINFQQFTTLIEELKKHRNQMKDKRDDKLNELNSLNQIVKTLQGEIDMMNDKIANQDLSPEDVRNMVNERQRLEEAFQLASENKASFQTKIKELELILRSKVQALEESVTLYQSYAEGLKLIPSTARNARGHDFNIEIDIRAKSKDGLLKSDIRKNITPLLTQLKQELSEITISLRSEYMIENDNFEEIENKRNELEEIKNESEMKIRRAESAYQREKELFDQNILLHAKEMDAMETRLVMLRDTALEEAKITAAKRRISESIHMKAVRKAEHDRKKASMLEAIMEVVSLCAGHRELVQSNLEELNTIYSTRLEILLSSETLGNSSNNNINNNHSTSSSSMMMSTYQIAANDILNSRETRHTEFLSQYLPSLSNANHDVDYQNDDDNLNNFSTIQSPYRFPTASSTTKKRNKKNKQQQQQSRQSISTSTAAVPTSKHISDREHLYQSTHHIDAVYGDSYSLISDVYDEAALNTAATHAAAVASPNYSPSLDYGDIYPHDSAVKDEANNLMNMKSITAAAAVAPLQPPPPPLSPFYSSSSLDYSDIYPQDSLIKLQENKVTSRHHHHHHNSSNNSSKYDQENVPIVTNLKRALYNNFDQCV